MIQSACFTGHRPQSFSFGYNEDSEGFEKLDAAVRAAIVDLCYKGYKRFYTGMAEGVDIWAAETVLSLTDKFEDLELIAAIPFPGQKNRMSDDFKKRYDHILDYTAKTIYISDRYTDDCFKKRNCFMVDHSDTVIAVYDSAKWRSGTGQTVRYAKTQHKQVIVIQP